jgi:Domain of unknown function (DUF4893)
MTRVAAPLILLSIAAACSTGGRPQPMPATASADWKKVATAKDMERIRGWRAAFTAALADARAKGNATAIVREGWLLEPDAALDGPPPAPGAYRCRVIKLGAKQLGLLSYVSYPAFSCSISDEGDVLGFKKTSGSQRPVGLVFPGDGPRRIFLGTLVLGDETRALEYGQDPMRDMAGAIERIGPNRWRMLLPYPNYESIMDVIELRPDVK